jgi:hypothetical protein
MPARDGTGPIWLVAQNGRGLRPCAAISASHLPAGWRVDEDPADQRTRAVRKDILLRRKAQLQYQLGTIERQIESIESIR